MLQSISAHFKVTKDKHQSSYCMNKGHYHLVHEFFYLLKGNCTIHIDQEIYKVSPGMFVMIPAGSIHRTTYLSGESHERILLYIHNDELLWLIKELNNQTLDTLFKEKVIKIPEKRTVYVYELIQKIIYEQVGVDEMSTALRKVYLYELFLFMIRCLKYKHNVIQKVDVKNEVIQRVIEYICENYSDSLTLNSLSHRFNMSESCLSKQFKAFTGFRLKEYIIQVRIKASEHYLLTTEKTITEIATLCGFNNSNFFGDTFRRINGISPSCYRKRC